MRIYLNFPEALKEVHRDLSEMGLRVHAKTYQDKYVGDDDGFATLELQNFNYCVLNPVPSEVVIGLPNGEHISPTQPWANLEFQERALGIIGKPVNPGSAWESRQDVWETFRGEDGRFAYSYGERFAQSDQVMRILRRAKEDEDSRQLWIAIWRPDDIENIGGVSRVPCTLGYQVSIRESRLHLHYIQRSGDFITHFCNDVYLASRLQQLLAEELGLVVGNYTHTVFSLHMFRKDAKGVF